MAISDLDITCTALKLIWWKDPYTGSPWCSTYKGEIVLVKAVEQTFIRKKKILCNNNEELSYLRDALPELHAVCYSPQSVDFKFLWPGVLTYSFKILRYFEVYAIFTTTPIGIYHLLPLACIQDTAFYPQKGCRKCMSAKKVEWLWWRGLKLHLCSLAANLSASGSPVSRHFSFSVFPKMWVFKFTWASHFRA